MKDWELKLPLKEMPDFTANERQTAEKEMPGLNVTEQDMGNNCSVVAASFSAAFHPSHDA